LATRPDYLLIVGNNTQIPAYPPGSGVMGSGHLTDLYYVTYGNPNHYSTGYANENQFLPDVAYGRLPHATVTELNNHIEKMLHVDKRLGDLEYFKRSIGIAGSETGLFRREADVTVDYAALHYFNASNGGSATVIKAPGYSDASIVTPFRNAFNAGAIYVNYTAHCNYDRWDTDVLRYSPATHQNNVHNFTNTGMYPLMVGNCCISAGLGGSVSPGVSIGAHAVQAQQRGGSTYIGGSNSTYWGADFFWSIGSMNTQQRNNPESVLPDPSLTGLGVYDRLFHTNFNERINDMHQIMAYGNRALMQSSANSDTRMIKYYWEIYHVFGDPSMMPSFGPQTTISIDDISMLTAIDQELVIQAVPHARVALTLDGELLATAMANATGLATLVFTEELPIGDAKLVITARNRIPYIATVPIMPANMPLLRVNDYRLNKNSGNVERMVFGEQVDFDFYLHNRSLVAAENIQIALTYDNTFVTIETFAPITTIAGQDGIWTPKRKITADINIPNNYDLEVTANITYFDNAGEEYNLEHTFNILAAAPQFVVSDFTANATNGSFTLTNVGLEPISGVQMQLTNVDNQLTVSNLSPATANFTIDNKLPFTFNVVKNVSDEFFVYSLKLTFSKGQFLHERPLHSAFGTFIEDFETGDFREPLWWREEGTEFGWHIVDTITTFTLEGVPIDNSGNAFEGKYAMRSNKIGHGQSTSVETDEFVLFGGDSIVFYYKVSSEDCSGTPNDCIDGGDALVFYTGSGSGWKREKAWYGEIPWTRAAIAVEEGPAFFKWAYEKNPKNSRGHDAAWVDYIVFPKLRQMSPPTSVTPPVVSLPDHILFDVVVNNGQLHARINADTYGKATIRLHNTLGQPVATIASNNTVNEGQNDFYFDMSNLPKGVYICTYFDGNRQLARKIIW
jgi:hypothetical protein